MDQNLKKIFKNIEILDSQNLSEKIWFSIVKREKRIIKLKLFIFSFTGICSLVSVALVIKTLVANFAQSGFYEYLSIAFSSGSNLFSYWKELIYSLAESLPILNIILSFSVIFIFILSLKYILKQVIKNNYIENSYVQI
ncbi:MAG: hypothetical protein WC662_02460 [Candidatus Paceibacterota bacterium]|jgi:hypothetical protein